MFLSDLLGAALTLLTLLLLGLSGPLLARLLLRERAREDALAFTVTALLSMMGVATVLAIALGAAGVLWIEVALPLLAGVTGLLWWRARALGDPWGPARLAARRAWERLCEHPALALLAVHAAASEGLRGLLRPPLSWDSLMYHLPIVATWIHEGQIGPVFGMRPLSFYGYMPAGGSAWLWWWMAPSHSELYINLAFFPQAALLALAAGAVARELGARRSWPLAAYLVFLMPTVIRWAATQYVDTLVGGGIAAATFFAIRWLRDPRWSDAVGVGVGLGLASGAKVLGLAYALGFAPLAVLLAWGGWRRRLPQVGAALLLCTLLGGFFYARNLALGAGPLAARCDPPDAKVKVAPSIPRINTVAYLWQEMLDKRWLLDSFLGVTRPGALELGVGPQVFLFLPALLLPLGFSGNRRAAFLVWSQIAVQLFVWVTVPYASDGHVFANVRYLAGALALAAAGVMAWAERRGVREGWLLGITLALVVQDLLMLHAEMPRGVRLTLAVVDGAAVVLALAPWLRRFAQRWLRELAMAAMLLAVAGAPELARFRANDRTRAFTSGEFTTHKVSTQRPARAWQWLDRHAGKGIVAVAGTPVSYFVYPAMGLRLERRATYVNLNRRNSRLSLDYPRCNPRVDPDPEAWVENLREMNVRWVWLSRYPQVGFPIERTWARLRPGLFKVRFEDKTNVIFEVLPRKAPPAAPGAAAPPGSPGRSRAAAG